MMPDTDDKAGGTRFAAVLGATSLVGRHLVRRLADVGFEGLCLGRRRGPAWYETPPGFAWRAVGADEALGLPASTILFSLAPISALPALLARTTGAERLIALGTSSVHFKARSSDPAERALARALKQAETEVRTLCADRAIGWTIFRPTLVYDPGHDRNVSAIAAFVRRFGVFPVAWPGTGRRQPIHADDVALAMATAASVAQARGTIFDLPGGETLTYRAMVRRIFEASGRRPILLYLPLGLARGVFRVWRSVTGARYSTASLERMNMDLVLDPGPVQAALGITCRPFRPGRFEPPEPSPPRRALRRGST